MVQAQATEARVLTGICCSKLRTSELYFQELTAVSLVYGCFLHLLPDIILIKQYGQVHNVYVSKCQVLLDCKGTRRHATQPPFDWPWLKTGYRLPWLTLTNPNCGQTILFIPATQAISPDSFTTKGTFSFPALLFCAGRAGLCSQ